MSDLKLEPNLNETIQIDVTSGKTNIILDASKFDLFMLCEARYNFRYNMKRALPILQKARALDSGTVAHLGLQTYYESLKQGVHFDDRIQNVLLTMKTAVADPDVSNLDEKELDIVTRAVVESCDYWRGEDENAEILGIEEPFAYVLYEDEAVRIIISGKIDLRINQPPLGRTSDYKNLPVDHKTFSRNFEQPRLSNQFINYVAVTGGNYLRVNKIGLQKTLKPEEKFGRPVYSYDPMIIEDWKDNTRKVILGRYLECLTTNEWTMNFTSCLKFNRLCEYYEVCDTSGQDNKIWKLENNFVEAKEWDVTEGLNEESNE